MARGCAQGKITAQEFLDMWTPTPSRVGAAVPTCRPEHNMSSINSIAHSAAPRGWTKRLPSLRPLRERPRDFGERTIEAVKVNSLPAGPNARSP